MDIIEIKESFVNFCTDGVGEACNETDANCVDVIGACYPTVEIDDIHFQVLIGNLTETQTELLLGQTIKFYVSIASDCDTCEPVNLTRLHIEQWKTSGTDQYDYFVGTLDAWADLNALNQFNDGDCFVLCLWQYGDPDQDEEYLKLGCSPCFRKIEDECDSTVLMYRQNESSMGFYNNGNPFYDTYFNSIRLPFKLIKPQTLSKKNVYRKSDGNYIKNSAVMSREWQGETDLLSEKYHFKLSVALEHDQIKVTNSNSGLSDQYCMSEVENNYKVDWPEVPGDYPHGKAEFKLMEMPFYEFNANCNLPPVAPTSGSVVILGYFDVDVADMPQLTIDSDNSGTYTSITDDGASGTITFSINGGAYAAFSSPFDLTVGDTLDVKRTISTASGYFRIEG